MTCARRPAGARTPAPSTSAGSRRPDARTGRARARRLSLLPVLALLLGALSPFVAAPAAAQLVSNLYQELATQNVGGQNLPISLHVGSRVAAQAFTTGSAAILSSIHVVARSSATAAQRNTVRAELWSATSGGVPFGRIATLTVPASLPQDGEVRIRGQRIIRSISEHGARVSFAAPANTRLEANTTYFLVLYTTGSFAFAWDVTSSDSEDKYTGPAGWSIANTHYRGSTNVAASSTSWTSQSAGTSFHIAVHGRIPPVKLTPATVSLSGYPAQAWEGYPLGVKATLSRAQPVDVRIPVQASPCPEGSSCRSLHSSKNKSIFIPAGSSTTQSVLDGVLSSRSSGTRTPMTMRPRSR